MSIKKPHFLFIIILVSIICLYGFRQVLKEGPKNSPPPQVPVEPKILTFYEEGWGGIYAGSWSRLHEVKEKVDLVSPVWLGLKSNGLVNWDKTNTEALSFFKQNKLQFLVLVTAGSGRNSTAILGSQASRQNAVNSIYTYLKNVAADGICLDFEYIQPALKETFTEFVKDLKAKMMEKKLLVAVFPYVNWEEPTKEAYDYQSLGRLSDGVIVMTYDQHRPKDTPGPVAAGHWVKANLDYLLTRIDNRKLWLGIAGYGYQWQSGKRQGTALPAWYCRAKAERLGFKDTYQPETVNEHINFKTTSGTFNIWWEGARGDEGKISSGERV